MQSTDSHKLATAFRRELFVVVHCVLGCIALASFVLGACFAEAARVPEWFAATACVWAMFAGSFQILLSALGEEPGEPEVDPLDTSDFA